MAKKILSTNLDNSNVSELTNEIAIYVDHVTSDVETALIAFGWVIHSNAVRLLQQGPTRTGIRRRGNTRRSAWGEPAKSENGNLQSSLVVRSNFAAVNGSVDVGALAGLAPYAKYLEDQYKLNRRFLQPAYNQAEPTGHKLIAGKIKAVKK